MAVEFRQPHGLFEGQTDRPLRYFPDGKDFVITNGTGVFNRPLYCSNKTFRVEGGDQPEFALCAPGRIGNLRLGVRADKGLKWLQQAGTIVTRYRPGSLLYVVQDPLLGDGELRLTLLPPATGGGLVARVELNGAPTSTELVWAFDGVRGDDRYSLETNRFMVTSSNGMLAGVFSAGTGLSLGNALFWNEPDRLLASANLTNETPVLMARALVRSNAPLFFALHAVMTSGVGYSTNNRPEALPAVFEAAQQRRQAVAAQVVVDTPDPFLNAAVPALCVIGDGIWDEAQGVYLQGTTTERSRLPGWRGPYIGDTFGWHDRAQRHLEYWARQQNTQPVPSTMPAADTNANLSRNEAALHSNGDIANAHQDMNLVLMDVLFRHFQWTGDLDFARAMWPVIERHLAWERRLFRREFGPEKLPLYEGYAPMWAGANLGYNGGGSAQATACNYAQNKLAARMAKLLGQDATPYEREAALIQTAMKKLLWQADRGCFAEWRDYLGRQLAHPNGGLWTFYQPVDCGVATPFEAWEMSRHLDTRLTRIPVRGPGVPDDGAFVLPTTDWLPYEWSLNNVVVSENLHTALACWQAGRVEEAYRLFQGCLLDSMFRGVCPGNLGQTSGLDAMRGQSGIDSADAAGIAARLLVEKLFGVQPDPAAGVLLVRPGFPSAWTNAGITHPNFNLTYRQMGLIDTYSIEPKFPRPMALRMQIPARRDGVESVIVNGVAAKWRVVEDAIGQPSIEIQNLAAPKHEVSVIWKGAEPALPPASGMAATGGELQVQFGAAHLREVEDPQNVVGKPEMDTNSFRATVTGSSGQRTLFAWVEQGQFRWWQPVVFEVRPPFEIVQSSLQDERHLRFQVRNNTAEAVNRQVAIDTGSRRETVRLRVPAFGESKEIVLSARGCLPGAMRVVISGLQDGELPTPAMSPRGAVGRLPSPPEEGAKIGRIEGMVVNWRLSAPPKQDWETVNLASVFNDKVTQIFRNEYRSPRSPWCSLSMPKQGLGGWMDYRREFEVDDTGLRAVAGTGAGRLLLPQGVPLQTPAWPDARNVVFASQWDNYPQEVTVPLKGRAAHVYLLMAGSTGPMQSRFDNGEVVVTYGDETSERLALRNPTTWWPIEQDYYMDDHAFRRPERIPPRVNLKTGVVRMLDADGFRGKGGPVWGGAATVLDLPLQREKELKSLTVRALANEVVVGLMSVTLARD